MTQAAVAILRTHAIVLSRAFGPRGPSALKPLSKDYELLVRHLARVVSCPDLDSLAGALRASDALLAAVEAVHRRRALAGILRIREAFTGIEDFIDQVPMAEPGQEPMPDAALDLPTNGRWATLLSACVFTPPMPKAVKARPARRSASLKRAA